MKSLFALLVAAVLTAGVASVYAEDASSSPGQGAVTSATDTPQHKKVRKNKKAAKKHHRKTNAMKTKKSKAAAETSEPVAQ